MNAEAITCLELMIYKESLPFGLARSHFKMFNHFKVAVMGQIGPLSFC